MNTINDLYRVYRHVRRYTPLAPADALARARLIMSTPEGIYRTLLLGYRSLSR